MSEASYLEQRSHKVNQRCYYADEVSILIKAWKTRDLRVSFQSYFDIYQTFLNFQWKACLTSSQISVLLWATNTFKWCFVTDLH